jgi:Tol biopolymer transport system component
MQRRLLLLLFAVTLVALSVSAATPGRGLALSLPMPVPPGAAYSDRTPVWSPSGDRIAFASNQDTGYWGVNLINADGTDVRKVYGGFYLMPSLLWAPDRATIGLTVPTVCGQHCTSLLAADGSSTPSWWAPSAGQLHWPAQSRRLVFTRFTYAGLTAGPCSSWHPGGDLFVAGPDGADPVNLTKSAEFEAFGNFSPDGERIAFIRSLPGGQADLWVMNADGTGQVRLTSTDESETAPEWSPDGTKIAFTSSGHVRVINPDGSNLRTLAPGNEFDWAPDGEELVVNTGSDLVIARADGSGVRPIAERAGREYEPDWSPDGSRIAFAADDEVTARDGSAVTRIYVVNVDDTGLQRLRPSGEPIVAAAVQPPDSTGLQPTVSAAVSARTVRFGESVTLSGSVQLHGATMTGLAVVVLAGQAKTPVGEAGVAPDGSWLFTYLPTTSTQLRARVRDTETEAIDVSVAPGVVLRRVSARKFLVETESMRSLAGRRVNIQRLDRGRWLSVKRVRLGPRGKARFDLKLNNPARLRAVLSSVQAAPYYASAASHTLFARR